MNLDTWNLLQVDEMAWLEEGANNLLRIGQTITFEAVLRWFVNVICRAPAANGREAQKTD